MKYITIKASWIREWSENLNPQQFTQVVEMFSAQRNGIISWTEDPFLIEYLSNFVEEFVLEKRKHYPALYSHADLIRDFNQREGFDTIVDEENECIIIKNFF